MSGQKENPSKQQAPIAKLCDVLVQQAIYDGAGRVVVEPTAPIPPARIIYKQKGELDREVMSIPGNLREPLIARFKKMAGLDPTLQPQGFSLLRESFCVDHDGKQYGVTLTVQRMSGGERIILDIAPVA